MKTGWLTLAALVVWTAALVLSGCGACPDGTFADGYVCPDLPGDTSPIAPEPHDLKPLEGQDAFAKIAWEALGQRGTKPPPIEWHREGCNGDATLFMKATGSYCVNGTYYLEAPFISAAVMSTPHESAVCHEYQHFIDWRDRGVSDFRHEGAAFQEGGPVSACELAQMVAGW